MNYEIEKGIPLPILRSTREKERFPFAILEIGESFVVSVGLMHCARSASFRVSRQTGRKFTQRKEGELVRFWRVT